MLPEPLALPLNQLAGNSCLSRPTLNVNRVQRVARSMLYHPLSARRPKGPCPIHAIQNGMSILQFSSAYMRSHMSPPITHGPQPVLTTIPIRENEAITVSLSLKSSKRIFLTSKIILHVVAFLFAATLCRNFILAKPTTSLLRYA